MTEATPPPSYTSIYKRLDVDKYEIRMLTILPGPLDSLVRCTLETTDLINPMNYSALSYCWGDLAITTNVIINDVEVPATVNLGDALVRLRMLGLSRIWVDAVCINQHNQYEKGDQIRKMKLIYSKAERTYAWLGREEVNGLAAAMAFFKSAFVSPSSASLSDKQHNRLGICSEAPGTLQQPSRAPLTISVRNEPSQSLILQDFSCRCCLQETHTQAFKDFFSRPYWARLWIIQEIAVTYQVTIISGQSTFALDDLYTAIGRAKTSSSWDLNVEGSYQHARTIFKFRDLQHSMKKVSLCSAIYMTRTSLFTDPRDRLFAVLGLSYDGPELVPTPNYIQPVEALLSDMTRALIRRTNYISVILANTEFASASTLKTLPSWTPDWFCYALPETLYADAYDQSTRFPLYQRTGAGQRDVLQVYGVIIGTVARTTTILGQRKKAEELSDYPTESSAFGQSMIESQVYYQHYPGERQATFCSFFRDKDSYHSLKCAFGHRYIAGQAWRIFSLFCQSASDTDDVEALSQDRRGAARVNFHQWLQANTAFSVDGQPLGQVIAERNLRITTGLSNPLALLFRTQFVRWPLTSQVFALSVGIVLLLAVLLSMFLVLGLKYSLFSLGGAGEAMAGLGLVWFIIIACVVILTPAVYLATLIGYLIFDIKEFVLLFDNYLTSDFSKPRRLVSSEKGMLGMAPYQTVVGDKICVLVGVESPVVLREVLQGNQRRYKIVGAISIRLSEADRTTCAGFETPFRYPHACRITKDKSTKRSLAWKESGRDQEIEKRRESGQLQEFQLI